jgi:hypothetical protein
MDTVSKFINLLHLPFLSSSDTTANAVKSAGKVVNTTKTIATTASQSLSSLHVPSLSSGELFGILVVVGVLILALTLGRTRTLISAVSLYVAFAFQTIFPFFGWLLQHQSFTDDLPTLRVFVFLAFYAISFALLNRSLLKTRFNLAEASFFAVVAMGLVQLGFMISIVINLAPSFYNIASRIPSGWLPYIGTQQALFWWSLAPIVLLVFQRSREY